MFRMSARWGKDEGGMMNDELFGSCSLGKEKLFVCMQTLMKNKDLGGVQARIWGKWLVISG
jgi:hypothetical protein